MPEEPHPAGLTEVAALEEGRRFTIQQHHARRLHHDVRFEQDGVLVSFAVPKRLPEEPGLRHLAVNTEDHPLDYLTFSGSIPAGEYGGGEVRLFDLGTYEPLEVADGKLTVRLHGSRYKGAEYHLFRTRDRDWLVILKGKVSLPQPAPPPTYEPMMAVLTSKPFDDDEWLFEVKWDGHRCLANLGTSTRLTSRTSRDMTAQFPELIDMHRQLAARNAVVDGEIVALDREGRPSFERMQDRFHRTPEELARNKGRVPVQFLAFDLLWLDGQPLLDLPLVERRARLVEVLVETRDIRLSQVVEGAGTDFFEQVRALQLEGIVAKRAASPYRPGTRSHDWRKIKALCLQDCVIVGWTPGKGGRSATLGSLLLAVYDDGPAPLRRQRRHRLHPRVPGRPAGRAGQSSRSPGPVRGLRGHPPAARGPLRPAGAGLRGRVPQVDPGRQAAGLVVQGSPARTSRPPTPAASTRSAARARQSARRAGRMATRQHASAAAPAAAGQDGGCMGAHILVVDDDPLLAAALRRPLAYEGFEVEVAASGEEALGRALDHPPDLVILDVLLPGIDGLEVCRRLRQAGEVAVLMLTARSEVPERVAGFEAGADDYLVKPFAFEELLVRVKALLRRGRNGSGSAELRFGDLRMDRSTHEVWRGERTISLTRQEFDLLALFLEHPRQVLTRSTILERVWDYDFGRDSNVLEVYVGYLRRKLEAEGEPRVIHTVRGVGYVLREDPEGGR